MGKIDWEYWGNKYIEEDLTQKEISKRLSIHETTVHHQFKERGIKKPSVLEGHDWDYWAKRYIEDTLTHKDIARAIGVHRRTVGKKFEEMGVSRPTKGEQVDWEYWGKKYIEEDLTHGDIANIVGLSGATVSREFERIGIAKTEDIDWKYIGESYFLTGELTVAEIASLLNRGVMTVYRKFDGLGIRSRKASIDWQYLGDKYYVTNKKNMMEIAEMVGVTDRNVAYHFNKLGIEIDYISYIRDEFEKYGYELLSNEYINSSSSIKYKCDRGHTGVTTWSNFKSGIRCAQCAREDDMGFYNPTLAERYKSKWLEELCYVYKVKLSYKNEKFYKIGISTNPENRFEKFGVYSNIKIIELIETNLYDAIYLEKELHEKHKEYRYMPDVRFGGYTECFTKLID